MCYFMLSSESNSRNSREFQGVEFQGVSQLDQQFLHFFEFQGVSQLDQRISRGQPA
jgi:hypothetical protein